MDKLLDFLNKIPNIQQFIQKLQKEGLSVKIIFDMLSSAGMAFFLMSAIAIGFLLGNLMSSEKSLNKFFGFVGVAVAFFIGYLIINESNKTT